MFSFGFEIGDVVFLYLAQDGSFDISNTSAYGSMTSTRSKAGTWQLNRITNITTENPYAIIELECDRDPAFDPASLQPSNNLYFTAVVTKVTLANVLIISTSTTLSAKPFSSLNTSSSGGIVAIIAKEIRMRDGSSISADAAGFSGGVKEPSFFAYQCKLCESGGGCERPDFVCSSNSGVGGQRGASIARYSEDPSVRECCRGALANGGGGGNNHNAAGGGGANVCKETTPDWTGDGVSSLFLP